MEGSQEKNPERTQYKTVFSSLTVAANLLLKIKKKMQLDLNEVEVVEKSNFNLQASLSTTANTIEHEMQQLKREYAERPQKWLRDLLVLLDTKHFNEFLTSLLDYFRVFH
eukprot:TRINITY_DN7985_c0_g1_i1.p2 TRINITY_DN7985_c0_g1~~TRINITY_DN7985_c0_g1_i1.p2  ORF type:complete len:122 (-),score=25.76 TRINITY_DN7985_c0_g1_i1:848-1177(-)